MFWRVSYSLCWLRLNPNKHVSPQTNSFDLHPVDLQIIAVLPVSHLWYNEVLPVFMV